MAFYGPNGLCGGPGKDGGAPDAGKPDTGKPDTALPDARLPDKEVPDVTPPDQAPPDASPQCGNGKLDPTEVCDGKLVGGKTCLGKGFTGGAMQCKEDCTLDLRGCYTQQATKVITYTKNVGDPVVAAGANDFFVAWGQWGKV